MNECICSSCKNLKCDIKGEEEVAFLCEFGFPSDECEACEVTECDAHINCLNYEIDNEEDVLFTVNCKKCGKQLKKAFDDNSEGDIHCLDCYLKD